MGKKTIKELEEEVAKLIKVNNSNFVEHQRIEHELRDVNRKKDKEIDICRNVIERKDQKISMLIEENSSLRNEVERFKFEEETDKAVIERIHAKIDTQIELHNVEKENFKNQHELELKEISNKL